MFLPTLRVMAVVAALYGSAFVPAQDHQSTPNQQTQKPAAEPEQQAASSPDDPPADEAAKPSVEPLTKESTTAPAAPAEEAEAASPQVPAQFFHGTITHFNAEFITVSRSLVGKRPESRRFLIIRTTKVHRTLRVRAKVTIRYKHLPQGDVALEIQIHPAYSQKS